ncbi:phosphatase PAP2 family protein [bacterium]|nr:phosphatase PAP2 family protein [bacterium]
MDFLKVGLLSILISLNLVAQTKENKTTETKKDETVLEKVEEVVEDITEAVTTVEEEQLIFENEFDNLIAPFTYQSSIALLFGGGLSFFLYSDRYEDAKKKKWAKESKKDKPWRDIGDKAGWGALPIAYSAFKFFQYQSTPDKRYLGQIEYVAKTVIYTGLFSALLKVTVRQSRPKDKAKYDSFPSGHASSAYSFATAIWLLHGWKYGLASTALATWIAYSRIDDGSHYYHDSAAGAAIGIAYAIGIYNNHYGRELPFLFSMRPTNKGMLAELSWDIN